MKGVIHNYYIIIVNIFVVVDVLNLYNDHYDGHGINIEYRVIYSHRMLILLIYYAPYGS